MRLQIDNARSLYQEYGASVVYISTVDAKGKHSIGTGFHVGEGVFLTARHVIADRQIVEIGNVGQGARDEGGARTVPRSQGTLSRGPLFHPNEKIDVAAIVVEGIDCPPIMLGQHLDDWLNDEVFILREVVVMGFPPVPLSKRPLLVAARAEINAVADLYIGAHPRFILSSTARGGFSGGPCLIRPGGEDAFSIGLVTEALVFDDGAPESGFFSVINVEPLFVCLKHHSLLPACQKADWEGFDLPGRKRP